MGDGGSCIRKLSGLIFCIGQTIDQLYLTIGILFKKLILGVIPLDNLLHVQS